MTALLMIGAVIGTISLLVSAANTGAKATASDDFKRGPWGLLNWDRTRQRDLNPHERRWQTSLLSARDNPSRWRDLVAEIEALERNCDVASIEPIPEQFNSRWLEASLKQLEVETAPHDPT